MAYIGKSPTGSGVRHRYVYTATGGETSLSGADDNSKTLKFTDGEYVDVHLNGVLLVQGTDYGVGTANTISSLAALAANDVVEITVYDVYNVAKINSEAMRNRWYYTATGGETSIGTSQISNLAFPANAEIDVKLNGVTLQAGTDYNTTSANTVGGLSALTAGQVVEIVYYERFVLADTVSKASGGNFANGVNIDGRLGVGTTTPARDLEVTGGTSGLVRVSGSTSGGAIECWDGTNGIYFGSDPLVSGNGSSGDLAILTDTGYTQRFYVDGSERMRVTANGLTFNGDTSSDNALDDYEEGTWTPTVSTASSVTVHSARYIKVGRVASLQAYIAWTNDQNDDSSTFNIGGFPFASVAVTNAYGAGSMGYVGSANMNDAMIITYANGGTAFYFHQNDGSGSVLTNANITDRSLGAFIFQITYETS